MAASPAAGSPPASSSLDGREEIVVYAPRKSKGVELYVGGAIYRQWTAVDITRSIETIAGSFDLTLAQPVAGAGDVSVIKPGASCKVKIDGRTVITGHIDVVAAAYDKENHTIGIQGRDAAGDLVDCSVAFMDGELVGRSPLDVITQICAPFDIDVRSDVSGLPSLPLYTLQPGMTAFEAIDQVAGYAAVLPVSDGLGGLVLTRAGTGPSFTSLELGKNIEAGRGQFSFKDRFSQYTVLGQNSAAGGLRPVTAYTQSATVTDPGVGRYRPLTLIVNFLATQADLQRRAEWEMAVRAGRAFRENITVRGWKDDSGQLWVPNGTIAVTDSFVGFRQRLVVAGVRYMLTEEAGEQTIVSVAPHQAFDLISQPLGDGFASPAQPGGAP